MAACLWSRILINQWNYMINIASVIGALTDPLVGNVLAKMTSSWFPLKSQVGAMSAISVASVLGPVIGSFYSLTFINAEEKNREAARSMMVKALLFLAITYTCIYVPACIFYREKPAKPPGYGEAL